jgi:unsaturated chondroitin disaccharide hydrolase
MAEKAWPPSENVVQPVLTGSRTPAEPAVNEVTSVEIPGKLRAVVKPAMAFAQEQVRRLITNHPDYFPLYTRRGRWTHNQEAWTNWCEGFLGGLIWIFAQRSGDGWWREQAEHYSLLIEHRKYDRTVHDLGFLFWPTWKRWYDVTGDPTKKQVVVTAGRTMAQRFQEKGRYLCSFVATESCFIDIMMNVGIIFYAAEQSGDEQLYQIALDHCLTTRRHLVRGDGSTAHEGLFDLHTGQFLRQATHQGWRDDSSWARGQAWAIHGFGTAYRHTRHPALLQTAERCADFFLERTPANGVPPNDWEEPDPSLPHESSAAAVAAGGLWQLAELTGSSKRAAIYHKATLDIVDTLLTSNFLAIETPGYEGILKHGIYHERKGLGVDESVMWGDYFLVDLLDRLLQK